MGRYKGKRYPANGNQLLIEIMCSVPQDDRDVQEFIDRVWKLITYWKVPEPVFDKTSSPTTVWFPETALSTIRNSGAATRLWLYLWIMQQRQKKRVIPDVKKFAEDLSVSEDSVLRYARSLEKAGKLTRTTKRVGLRKVEEWAVKA